MINDPLVYPRFDNYIFAASFDYGCISGGLVDFKGKYIKERQKCPQIEREVYGVYVSMSITIEKLNLGAFLGCGGVFDGWDSKLSEIVSEKYKYTLYYIGLRGLI